MIHPSELPEELIDMIKDELNVKELIFVDNIWEIYMPQFKINFKTLSDDHKNKDYISRLQHAVNNINSRIVKYYETKNKEKLKRFK